VIRGLLANRQHPDLEALAAETDSERFVWEILPHAARSFAASISVLPPAKARPAALAYLYCRMLDTYEDLYPNPDLRPAQLEHFASRFETRPMPEPGPIPDTLAVDDRDHLHLLLVARWYHLDAVLETLPRREQDAIARLVNAMAKDMAASSKAFSQQGGVLISEEQVARYCHGVIGHPVLFVLQLLGNDKPLAADPGDAMDVSEMIQLANITRDIEKDLLRGIGYHPALKPYLGRRGPGEDLREAVRRSREQHLRVALLRAPAYRRLFRLLPNHNAGSMRTAAVLMFGFTDLHYRRTAAATGHEPWRGPKRSLGVVARALPAFVSQRWAQRIIDGIERNFLEGARRLPAEWDFGTNQERRHD
jgi:phytoene/squalene synthetase